MGTIRVGELRCGYELPRGRGPFPAVVLVHEVYGPNTDMEHITARLLDAGYVVCAPDLYSAMMRPLGVAATVLDARRGPGTATVRRLGAVRAWLAEQPEVGGEAIGVIGFGMGAGFALAAAARHPFKVAAVNYGRVPATAAALKGVCPVVASYGSDDTRLKGAAERLESHLETLQVPNDIAVYEGAGRGFMNTSVPGFIARRMGTSGHDRQAAAHAWGRTLAFFDARLRRRTPRPSIRGRARP